jgi:TM2 domain-containing membrane protein YozV
MSSLDTAELALIETRVAQRAPNVGLAYLFWFVGGMFGFHRFYLGRPGTAILMLFTLGGFGLWAFIDLFLIGGMAEASRQKIYRAEVVRVTEFRPSATHATPVVAAPRYDRETVAAILETSPRSIRA